MQNLTTFEANINNFPSIVYNSQQVRELDQRLINNGVSGFSLMQKAAQATFDAICNYYPEQNKITIFTGGGNNAGDGYLIACLAQQQNWQTQIIYLIDPQKLKNDALLAYQQAKQQNIAILPFKQNILINNGIIVDAILGTGCSKNVAGEQLKAIELINNSGLSVCAVDIPSGLNADTGNKWGIAVNADLTVTYIGLKLGLFSQDGPDCCGKLLFANLDAEPTIVDNHPFSATRITPQRLPTLLARKKNSHKGMFGHCLIIGGDDGMIGAPILASLASLRSGAGLVTLASKEYYAQNINLNYPEIMTVNADNAALFLAKAKQASVAAIGPGFGNKKWQDDILQLWIANQDCFDLPQVWDADGLNWLAGQPSTVINRLTKQINNLILTPHPAEAARLLKVSTKEVQGNRIEAAKEITKIYNATVILKGIGSLVSQKSGAIYLCDRGHPAMSGAGFGDVLTGWVVGLLAQGLTAGHACCLATWLHAVAGEKQGVFGRGVLASDLINSMRAELENHSPIL